MWVKVNDMGFLNENQKSIKWYFCVLFISFVLLIRLVWIIHTNAIESRGKMTNNWNEISSRSIFSDGIELLFRFDDLGQSNQTVLMILIYSRFKRLVVGVEHCNTFYGTIAKKSNNNNCMELFLHYYKIAIWIWTINASN